MWLFVFAVCPVFAQAAEVTGLIRLRGKAPAPETVKIEPKKGVHSTEGCGSLEKQSQKLIVDSSGGVQSAVVWLDLAGGASAPAAQDPVLLDQRECLFSPHVVCLAQGGQVAIRNSDTVLHNIRIFPEGKPDMLMHQWQKADAADIAWSFPQPGRYVVRCGVHPWMYAWVVVLPERCCAGVTNSAGEFSLKGVPPGSYRLRVWHETLGEKEMRIEVAESGALPGPIYLESSGG